MKLIDFIMGSVSQAKVPTTEAGLFDKLEKDNAKEKTYRKDYERDLNKVDDEELAQTKAVMSVEFEAHQLKPGDEGFVYDKRVEFEGACLGVEPWSRTQWSVPQLLR